jgi:hypothetical protein
MTVGETRSTLSRRRAAEMRLVVAAIALAALIVYAVLWLQVSPARERGTDFSASYVAALVVREGDGGQIYNQGVEAAKHAAILLPGYRVNLPFITPPTTALLAIPLTFLDPGAAFRLFSILQLLLLVAGVAVAARAGPWPGGSRSARWVAAAAAVAGSATLPLLLLGQWDGLCALGLALAYTSWRRDRPFSAGLWLALGFGIAKPHLAIGLLAFAIGRRDRRALLGMVTGAVALIAVSVVAVGPSATLGFLGASSFALGNTPAASTLGLLGLAASWLGSGSAATGIAIAGGVLGIAACGLAQPRPSRPPRGDARRSRRALPAGGAAPPRPRPSGAGAGVRLGRRPGRPHRRPSPVAGPGRDVRGGGLARARPPDRARHRRRRARPAGPSRPVGPDGGRRRARGVAGAARRRAQGEAGRGRSARSSH